MGNAPDVEQRNVSLAPLHGADVVCVQAGSLRQLLLRDELVVSMLSDRCAKRHLNVRQLLFRLRITGLRLMVDDLWRYTLGCSGSRPLLAIGLNPSTATQERADPTVARVQRVAELHGFDGFVMLNLYPVRATNYRTLPAKVNAVAFQRNLQLIEEVVSQRERPTV